MIEICSRNFRGLMTDRVSDLAILEVARIGRPFGSRIAHQLCFSRPHEFTGRKKSDGAQGTARPTEVAAATAPLKFASRIASSGV